MAQLLFRDVTVSRWLVVALLLSSGTLGHPHELPETSNCTCAKAPEPEETPWYLAMLSYLSIVFLVGLSGLFSGLTLGLLGLDMSGLEIVAGADNKELARCAEIIMPVRKHGNLLLCTLLLGNVAVNCLLAILMGQFGDGIMAFLLSTVLIVVFGEIVPQSTCSRYALQVGAKAAPLVKVIICLLFPLTAPLAWCLDKLLGDEVGTVHSKTELDTLIKIEQQNNAVSGCEADVIRGALTFREKLLKEVLTPIEEVYMLPASTKLDFENLQMIFRSGFSKIPVYGEGKDDPVGLLVTKDLLIVDPSEALSLGTICETFHRKLASFPLDQTLGQVFDSLKEGRARMIMAYEIVDRGGTSCKRSCGVITLEDILEEIIQEEIHDEDDADVVVNPESMDDKDFTLERSKGFDVGKLKLLDPKHMENKELSEVEISAIAKYLRKNVTDVEWPTGKNLNTLLQGSEVVFKHRATTKGKVLDADYLYRVGEGTDKCTIILKGSCATFATSYKFRAYYGNLSVLAKDVLSSKVTVPYSPDFSAYVVSRHIRYLVITRSAFDDALKLPPDVTGDTTDVDPETSAGAAASTKEKRRPSAVKILGSAPLQKMTKDDPEEAKEAPAAAAAPKNHPKPKGKGGAKKKPGGRKSASNAKGDNEPLEEIQVEEPQVDYQLDKE